jgi:hypothetical protein
VASVWELKPWWCQPWSILVTGLTVIAMSWWILHLWWISLATALAIGAWWILFLVLMPTAWRLELSRAPEAGMEPEKDRLGGA